MISTKNKRYKKDSKDPIVTAKRAQTDVMEKRPKKDTLRYKARYRNDYATRYIHYKMKNCKHFSYCVASNITEAAEAIYFRI